MNTLLRAGWLTVLGIAFILAAMTVLTFVQVVLREVTHLSARARNLNVTLEKMALVDGLTGLANRRQFDDRLAAEWSGAARRRSPIAMLMIDARNCGRWVRSNSTTAATPIGCRNVKRTQLVCSL